MFRMIFFTASVNILHPKSESVDPHFLAVLGPGSHNVVDPSDPDPKNWQEDGIQKVKESDHITIAI